MLMIEYGAGETQTHQEWHLEFWSDGVYVVVICWAIGKLGKELACEGKEAGVIHVFKPFHSGELTCSHWDTEDPFLPCIEGIE